MSSFDFWKNEFAGAGSSALFPLTEGRGLPLGWVSLWTVGGKKTKHQKTKDGWVEVPGSTPLGQQPFGLKIPVKPQIPVAKTPDEELGSYLQTVKFDDPKIQTQLLKSKKFVQDMVAKFGGNWQHKAKTAADAGEGKPPEAPPPTTDPVTAVSQTMGYAPDSHEAFVVAQLHKNGDTEKATNAYSQKFGVKYGKAANYIDGLVKSLVAKGLISTDSMDELDSYVKFNVGSAGVPVTSAPTLAVTTSAPTAPPAPQASKELDNLIASLGYKAGTDAALAVGLIKASPDDLKGVASALAAAQGLQPVVAAAVVAQVHQKMTNAGAVAPAKKTKKKPPEAVPAVPAEPPPTTLANLSLDKVNAIKKKLDVKQGTIGDWVLSALVSNEGDEGLAVAALVAVNPKIDHEQAKKLAAAMNTLALASLAQKSVFGLVDDQVNQDLDLPINTNVLMKPKSSAVAAPIPFVPPSGKSYAPLPASLVGLSPKMTDAAIAAGFSPNSEEAKLLNLWQSNGGQPSPQSATIKDLVNLGWGDDDAQQFVKATANTLIDKSPAVSGGGWWKGLLQSPVQKPVLTPPAPDLGAAPALPVPTDAKVLVLAKMLGFAPTSVEAKMLAVWRKHFISKKLDASLSDAAVEISTLADNPYVSDAHVLSYLKKLVNDAYANADWDSVEFAKAKPTPTDILSLFPQPDAAEHAALVSAGAAYLASAPEHIKAKYMEDGGVSPEDHVFFGALAAYTGDDWNLSIHSALKQAGEKFLGMDGVAAGAAASNFLALMKDVGFVIESPGGDEFVVGSGQSPFKWPSAGAEVEPAKVSPEPAAPTGSLPPLPAPPPLSVLTDAGDAKKKLGGNKPKRFMKDSGGTLFLYKHGADVLRARGGEAASNLSALIAGAGAYVPVKAVEKDGDWGTIQPVVPNIKMLGSNETAEDDLIALSKEQIQQLQRERVIDWVCANHDCKIGNFIKTKDGNLLGIDKEQAFKFIGQDSLSTDYKPNPSPPVYNALYDLWSQKKIDLDPNDVLPFIQAVEGVSEADWVKAVKPYIDALPASERASKHAAILARKNGLRAEFEVFFTGLMKKRGDLPMAQGMFKFPKTGTAAVPKPSSSIPGLLATPTLPSLASLTYAGSASGIGGASEKHWFKDDTGKKWMVKLAADKNSGKAQPFKAAAAAMFSKVGLAVKSNTVPIGVTSYKGTPANIQPWVEATGNLANKVPAALTAQQKADVAAEHILDWMMSQHDSHGANLLLLPDGRIAGIDKEQAFKFLLPNPKLPNTTPDQLSTDYHPNTMENPPYYNKFWGAFADGKMDFDPTVMKSAIEAVEKIPDDAYAKELASYAEKQPGLSNAEAISVFYSKALARKQNIRADFEKFVSELYEKRTKKKGKFTFLGGWAPEGAVVAAPAATAQPLPAAPAPALAPAAPAAPAPAPAAAPVAVGPVPVPMGYTPPNAVAIATAAGKLGIATSGVYFPALTHLAKYANHTGMAAQQLAWSKGIPYELALKRVKYAAKKLKAAGGWAALGVSPASQAPVAPAAPASAPVEPLAGVVPSEEPSIPAGTGGVTKLAPNKPTAKGALGLQEVELATPGEYKPPPPPPPPPVPAGFPAPPPGKMWEVQTAKQFADKYVYKVKSPKDAEGNLDPSSPNVVVKLKGLDVSASKDFLEKLGVEALITPGKPQFKEKDGKVLVLVDKATWEGALQKKGTSEFSQLVPIPPPEPPPDVPDQWKPTPKPGQLRNPEAVPNVEDLHSLHLSNDIGFGHGLFIDGGAVEHQSVSVQRNVDLNGKVFYRFQFKVREPTWKKFKGGTESVFNYNRTKYDETKDAWEATSAGGNPTDVVSGMRKWSDGDSKVYVGTSPKKYAYRGAVFADVYLNENETLHDGFKRMLDSVHPGLSAEVLKNPSKGERDLLALSALYWSVAPQQADSLSESQRTVPELKSRLTALGYTEADFGNLGFERVAMDRIVPVLKGRHLKLKSKYGVMNIGVGVDTESKVVKQLASGTIGVAQRLQHGIPCVDGSDASPSSDQQSGGADYVYTRVDRKTVGWPSGYGSIQMIYDPSELDRLDVYQHSTDHYGTCNPNESGFNNGGHSYKHRTPLEASSGSAFEVCFRRGISSRKLLKIVCSSSTERDTILKLAKDAGITKMNGMDLADLVITSGSYSKGLYAVHLQPAGY